MSGAVILTGHPVSIAYIRQSYYLGTFRNDEESFVISIKV